MPFLLFSIIICGLILTSSSFASLEELYLYPSLQSTSAFMRPISYLALGLLIIIFGLLLLRRRKRTLDEKKLIDFPYRSRIAAGWMRNFGIFLLCLSFLTIIFGIILCFGSMSGCPGPSKFLCKLTTMSPGAQVFFQPGRYANCPDAFPWVFGSGIILIIYSRFLLKKKKWAWIFSVISLSIFLLPFFLFIFTLFVADIQILIMEGLSIDYLFNILYGVIMNSIHAVSISIIPHLIPLLLLAIDRKNFWEIAS